MFRNNKVSDLLRFWLFDLKPSDGETFLLTAQIISEMRKSGIIPKYDNNGNPLTIEDFNSNSQHLNAVKKIQALNLDNKTLQLYLDTYGWFCSFLRMLSMGFFNFNYERWIQFFNENKE